VAEAMVIHGDGCMTGCGMIPRAELFLAYLMKKRHKPVALLNHTADLSDTNLRTMIEQIYPRLDVVTFREERSAAHCREFCDGLYVPDSAFLYTPAPRAAWLTVASRPGYFDVWPDRARFDPAAPYVCVGGSSAFSFSGIPREISAAFAALCRHLQESCPVQLVLTASDGKDERILRPVAAALDLPLVALTTPVSQAVDILGHAAAYVGGRWHPSIFALSGGAPVVPLRSKTFKIEALLEMAGLDIALTEIDDLESDRTNVAERLAAVLEQGDVLRDHLRTWAATQRDTARQTGDLISGLR
jgi:polysaccharide pyruvyl transferase WcaK-like protein